MRYKFFILGQQALLFMAMGLFSFLVFNHNNLVVLILLLTIIIFLLWSIVNSMQRFCDKYSQKNIEKKVNVDNIDHKAHGENYLLNKKERVDESFTDIECDILKDLPIALIAIHQDNAIELLNKEAYSLVNSEQIGSLPHSSYFENIIASDIYRINCGETIVSTIELSNQWIPVILSAANMKLNSKLSKVISVQPIQQALDKHEVVVWKSLIGVLNHAIMSSITPIASLSSTATSLISKIKETTVSQTPLLEEKFNDIYMATDTVAQRSEYLKQYIQLFQQVTSLPKPSFETIKIKDLLVSVKKLSDTWCADNNIALTSQMGNENIKFQGDPVLLQHALIHLIENAIEALARLPQGKITLSIIPTSKDKVIIEVADNGPGITTSSISKIFLPFYTSKRGKKGMGLAIVRQIIDMHKGMVSAYSSKKGGAIFRVTI